MDDFDMLSAPQGSAGNGVAADEDPAAAFLAQQESEIVPEPRPGRCVYTT